MIRSEWQPTPAGLARDAALLDAVEAVYRDQHRHRFADEANANPLLTVQTRALRRIDEWRVFLLLTPWMLARLFFHDGAAPLAVPPDWSAAARGDRDDTVIGPALTFTLHNGPQQAHLNFHAHLGHYLLQPLMLAMHGYTSPEAVFAAWDQVIKVRDENMARMRKCCPMQEEISRREFLSGVRGGGRGAMG